MAYKDYSCSVYVKAVQALVGAAIDGKYGPNTRKNVIAFQATAGLEQTGNIYTNDWLALFDCSYTRTAKTSLNGVKKEERETIMGSREFGHRFDHIFAGISGIYGIYCISGTHLFFTINIFP